MSTLRKVANALSFAHLAGFAGKARAEGDDPEDKEKDKANGEDSEKDDKAKSAKVDDDERKQREGESDDDYSKRMKKMDEEEDDKEKEAKADDDSDEEMRGNSNAAAARKRERARCAAIFGSKAAGKNTVLAANLAFNTSMTRKEALAVLEGTPAPQANVQRRNPNLDASGGVQQSTAQATAARWDANLKAASGRRGK